MKILASLCNIGTEFKSGLLLLNEDLTSYRCLRTPQGVPPTGMTGLALSDKDLIICSQGGTLCVLDRKTLALKCAKALQLSRDTHSIMVHEGRLYAVATGLNAVVVMDLNNGELGPEQIYWKMGDKSYGRDVDHLNSICVYFGKILVSGFGPKPTSLWSSAKKGFLVDVTSGKKLYEGFYQPHSLTSYEGSLLVCESAKSSVLDLSLGKVATVDGYVRGLCIGPKGLYAAVSRGRTVSRSTGLIITNPRDRGDLTGHSAIYLLDRDTFEIKKVLGTGSLEFYDLAMVGDEADAWPTFGP